MVAQVRPPAVAAGEERVFVELTAIVKMLERALYGITARARNACAATGRAMSRSPSPIDEIATGVAAVEAELAKAGIPTAWAALSDVTGR
jgi:hypothetical protein